MTLLYVDCPCTSFPRSFARDYKETYLYPPPSTIYGFLLSLVGEEDLSVHIGVRLALGLIGEKPPISRILHKQRSHKFANGGPEHKKRVKQHGEGVYPTSKYSKPNFQELLTDLKIVVNLDSSQESGTVTLEERIAIALTTPNQIRRFGGVSLGESWALIKGVRPYQKRDGQICWLLKDQRGLIALPKWIDRKTGRGIFQRFSIGNPVETETIPDSSLVKIQPTTN